MGKINESVANTTMQLLQFRMQA